MSSVISLIWKVLKLYGRKLIELFYRLVKAQLRAILWKYGLMFVMIALTVALAFVVLR